MHTIWTFTSTSGKSILELEEFRNESGDASHQRSKSGGVRPGDGVRCLLQRPPLQRRQSRGCPVGSSREKSQEDDRRSARLEGRRIQSHERLKYGDPLMRLAIATSKNELPSSDEALKAALGEQGMTADPVLWSSPGVAWQSYDAVVIRSCWDYHLRLKEFLDWINQLEHAGVAVLNSPSLIRWNVNKLYLKELSAKGVRIPKTVWLDPGEEADLARVCSSGGWANAVVKPLVSASAYKTDRNRVGIVKGPAMIQEYLTPIETNGEWSLMYFGGCFSHAVRKMPASGDFRVQTEFGGTVVAAVPQQAMLAFAVATIARLPEPASIARVDVLEDEDGFVLVEMEVIEPELFLGLAPGSERLAARAIMRSLVGAITR